MFISVNPTYFCNFRCSFCYLTKEQLSDAKTIDPLQLAQLMDEIQSSKPSEKFIIDLYGGEITSLDDDYVLDILRLLYHYTSEPIRITTNLSRIPDYLFLDWIDIAVSYDYNTRQDHEIVFKNMQFLGSLRDFDILMLASKNLIKTRPIEIITKLDKLPGLRALEIKPYSTNQANQHVVPFTEFENFVQGIATVMIMDEHERSYILNNLELLNSVICRERNAFSDDHIYITPNAKFAVLEFDKDDNEFFQELHSFKDYIDWTHIEKSRVTANSYCMSCEYYGNCLSEHLREVTDISQSCNGFKGLIDWYQKLLKN